MPTAPPRITPLTTVLALVLLASSVAAALALPRAQFADPADQPGLYVLAAVLGVAAVVVGGVLYNRIDPQPNRWAAVIGGFFAGVLAIFVLTVLTWAAIIAYILFAARNIVC